MLERLWMTVRCQISLAFLFAFSRTCKIHLCVQRRDLFQI